MGYNALSTLSCDSYSDDGILPRGVRADGRQAASWTIDFHVAQNDGEVHGAGSHDKTGKHCRADDPNGKLDITKCARLLAQGLR